MRERESGYIYIDARVAKSEYSMGIKFYKYMSTAPYVTTYGRLEKSPFLIIHKDSRRIHIVMIYKDF